MNMKGTKLCVAIVISNLATFAVTTVAVLYAFQPSNASKIHNGMLRQEGRQHRKEQECCGCNNSPTSAPVIPLTSTTFSCPDTDGASIDFVVAGDGALIEFNLSTGDRLCTLVRVAPDGSSFKPIGRSYNGHNWESSAGEFSASVSFSCWQRNACTARLDSLADTGGAVYQLTSFDVPLLHAGQRDEIARFLEQATFGPTQADINAVISSSTSSTNLQSTFANWIRTQQTSVPITSHRALWRSRVNARMEHATGLGAVTHPCHAGTRYRRYAFSIKDRRKFVEIRSVGQSKIISIDGFIRTVVAGPIAWYLDESVTFGDGSFLMPWVVDLNYIGGNIFLTHPDRGSTEVAFNGVYGNPPVNFDPAIGASPNVLINLSNSDAQPIDTQYFQESTDFPVQELILSLDLSYAICTSLREPGNPVNPVFARYQNQYWIHDPRFETFDNTVESPAMDGGGAVKRETANVIQPDLAAQCSNVPRTFVNEDTCVLSMDPLACNLQDEQDEVRPQFYLTLDHPTIRTIYETTGRFLYVIDGLRYEDDFDTPSPCQRGTRSRWMTVPCTGAATNAELNSIFGAQISRTKSFDENPLLRTFYYNSDEDCPVEVFHEREFEVQDLEGECWLNVHPDHLSVYDMTSWASLHPGNLDTRNPIKEFAEAGETTLQFPGWHEMSRWTGDRYRFGYAGALGDTRHYYDLPVDLRSYDLSVALGFTADAIPFTPSDGVLVCGSPYEIANDLSLGGSQGRGAFDSMDLNFFTTDKEEFTRQKRVVWTQAALAGEDQLRQRVAWALAQILVISPDSVTNGAEISEAMTTYYDIFIRHAFGNYRDILKEVAYSPLMAEMLTYYGSRSTAFTWRIFGNLEYADENFAREIMQLFTMGLYRMNQDGSQVIGQNGDPERTYTNDDIVEYARVWTGFVAQYNRGNTEQGAYRNQVDPMVINMEYRDVFPKMGLNRRYIGDGYALCADLPASHFLEKGAKYRLLGRKPRPDLLEDPEEWEEEITARRFVLQPNGANSLFAKLCKSQSPTSCQFDPRVLLDETVLCNGEECSVDTVRVVQVGGMYYEYIRPPCVYQAFFNNARMVHKRFDRYDLKCADPRTQVASATCCTSNTATFMDTYWGERTTFATAQERCQNGEELCNDSNPRPNCYADTATRIYCANNEDYWTNTPCTLRAKIDNNGNVAIIHEPLGIDPSSLSPLINEADSKTFFRVDWSNTNTVESIITNCNSFSACTTTSDGMCMCEVTVVDEQVFSDGDAPSVDDVLTALHIGAYDPSMSSYNWEVARMGSVTSYTLGGTTVFSVTDDKGTHFRKNIKSTVRIVGANLEFRNPPHFVSISDAELRDGQDETDAALDHYFHHPNTAPFLAIRFAQRFGISNPSPRYIESIATAFRTGSYSSSDGGSTVLFGSGNYGDLEAMTACVLLDREARSVILDADPSHGSLKEPLIKMIGLLRSMEFRVYDNVDFVDFDIDVGVRLGQFAHDLPNVFSFFLPKYKPSGPVAQASLVAPEGQVLTGPRLIDTLNGMMSLIKYGHSTCFGGLAPSISNFDCGNYVSGGSNEESLGRVTLSLTAESSTERIVDELSTLLTGGRLSTQSREIIGSVFDDEPNSSLALIKAQQLMLFSPEFHSTGVTRRTENTRPELQVPPASNRPYKAVVYVLLDGGMDSFNMLAPHRCSATNSQGDTLLEQYEAERTSLAMTEAERIRIIDAAEQPCDQFAIHQNLGIVESLYNAGDLAFFANAGVLSRPVTKKNYGAETKTNLFSHSDMQQEAQRMDPFDGAPGTGILGRMCDLLNTKGYNAQPITVEDATIATVGAPGTGNPDPLFISSYGASEFNPKPDGETFDPKPSINELNDAVHMHSNIFGETWSQRLQKALHDNESLLEALENTELTQQFEDDQYSRKLQAVSTLIVSHGLRGTDRDVFYVSLSGWDSHSILKEELEEKFGALNSALTSFYNEMNTQSFWDDVSLVITSDFGRTLTANSGEGSDHAWGGNYFVMGGAVAGGKIHGDYPADITAGGPLNVGRGRLIPTMSWESIFNPLAEWMGVETEAELNQCMPNRGQTGTKMYTSGEVFN